MSKFPKTLIANQGEIAISVMRAANKLGKQTTAVCANEDKTACIYSMQMKPTKLRMVWASDRIPKH